MVSAMTQLFNILPNLALVGLALSGLEGIPVSGCRASYQPCL